MSDASFCDLLCDCRSSRSNLTFSLLMKTAKMAATMVFGPRSVMLRTNARAMSDVHVCIVEFTSLNRINPDAVDFYSLYWEKKTNS